MLVALIVGFELGVWCWEKVARGCVTCVQDLANAL